MDEVSVIEGVQVLDQNIINRNSTNIYLLYHML